MAQSGSTLRERLTGQTMGTEWSLQWCSHPSVSQADVQASIEEVFARIIEQMSTWDRESEISHFNQLSPGATLEIGPDFQKVLIRSFEINRESGGAFDPTLGALISRRGYGASVPPVKDITGPLGAELWAAITPKNGRIKQLGGVRLDLSAIAKGYAVDETAAVLRGIGITQSLVEIGGEFRGSGVKPDGLPWWVDLETESPQLNQDRAPIRIALYELSLATSGGFRQANRTKNGIVSHIIPVGSADGTEVNDPNLSCVSVLHDDCMSADAWATAFFAQGLRDGLALANSQDFMAIFQTAKGDYVFSDAAQGLRF